MKKSLTQATGIMAIVFGAIDILLSIMFVMFSIFFTTGYYTTGFSRHAYVLVGALVVYLILAIMFLGVGIAQIVCGAKVLQRLKGGRDTKNLLVALTVLAFFGGILVGFVFAIIALTAKEDAGDKLTCGQPAAQGIKDHTKDFEGLVLRLKQYKADGIITDEVYSEKIEEAVKRYAEELKG